MRKKKLLHARQEALEAKLRATPPDDIAVLHPSAAERYRQKVAAWARHSS